MDIPKLVVRVPRGESVFTTVVLNGQPLPATRVQFDTGDGQDTSSLVKVTVTFYADLDLEVEGIPAAVTALEPV
jgi:hypothetical protein